MRGLVGTQRRGLGLVIRDIAGIATAVGVLLAVFGLFAQTHQKKFALAQLYIKRYWAIDDDLTRTENEGASTMSARARDVKRYLRLCEDEFEIARLGWIDAAIWDVWHEGICTQITKLQAETNDFALLTECATGGDGHSARRCPAMSEMSRRHKLIWWFERRLGD